MFRPIVIALLVLVPATIAGCGGVSPRPEPAVQAPARMAEAAADDAGAADPIVEPALRLPPAALVGELALQQRLTFRAGERRDTVDALVEADAGSVRVLVHMQGQVALRLHWDGSTLDQQRADWLPPQLQGERVLSDLQLVYWPAEAVQAGLPPGWRLERQPGRRRLWRGDLLVVDVRYPEPDLVVVSRPGQGLALRIESTPVTP